MRDGFVGAFQGAGHVALHLVQFGVPVDGGQRRAQLMAGVGDEPFHLVGGLLLLMETSFDPRQHGVQ